MRRCRRCSAARSRCTPTPSTRRSRCRPISRPRIARNTQLILQNESQVTEVVDPLGGSYYVEALTHSLATRRAGHHRRGRRDGRHDQGGRSRHSQAQDRGSRRPPPGPRRSRRGCHRRRQQVPVATKPSPVEVRDIDNAAVRDSQIARLKKVRAEPRRSQMQGRARRRSPKARRATGNLLALAVDAARARATVGEISDAMEKVFGRHRAEIRSITGVYGHAYEGDNEFAAIRGDVEDFAKRGRPPPAHPRRQDGAGRPRSRRQGHRHRLCRSRLRCRYRSAVPDAGGSGEGRRRCRRACGRRFQPGRRPQDAGAAADRGAERARAPATSSSSAAASSRRRIIPSSKRPASPPSSAPAPTSSRPRARSSNLIRTRRKEAA